YMCSTFIFHNSIYTIFKKFHMLYVIAFNTLNEIIKEVNLPFVLIGGISLDNVHELKLFNPDGYALVSGILAATDIISKVKLWNDEI
ncbi:hypothetical protein GNF68_17185, partial [Clostridium perfringens]